MKRGMTIAGERERLETRSERVDARKKAKRRSFWSVIVAVLLLAILGLMTYLGAKAVVEERKVVVETQEEEYKIQAQVIDEAGKGQVSARMKQYIGQLEQDFKEAGYVVKRVVLPAGTSRELYVDLEGEEMYFKVTVDRDAAVTVEDAVRMMKYLDQHEVRADYVDVRVEGKAFYKESAKKVDEEKREE